MTPDLDARIHSLPAGTALRWHDELDALDAAFGGKHEIDPEFIDWADDDVKAEYEQETTALAEDFLRRVGEGAVAPYTDDDFKGEKGDAELFAEMEKSHPANASGVEEDPDAIPDPEDAPDNS